MLLVPNKAVSLIPGATLPNQFNPSDQLVVVAESAPLQRMAAPGATGHAASMTNNGIVRRRQFIEVFISCDFWRVGGALVFLGPRCRL
jgi:hypothetical protein